MMGRLFGQARERERQDELLSAYLDSELSAGEQARLEAQLADDPALQAELDALRQAVTLVRDLPQVPIPRNFILPQTMAARPHRAWAAPLLTAATAIASFLFIALLSLDLLLPGMRGNLAFAPAPEPQMAAEAPREMPVEQEVEAGDVVDVASPPAAEAPAQVLPEAPVEEEEQGGAPALAGEKAATPATRNGAPTVTPASVAPSLVTEGFAATSIPTVTTLAEVGEDGEDHWDSAPGETAGAAPSPVEEKEIEPTEDEMVGVARPASWRSLEIVLGLIALALASATAWAWRARR